MVSSIGVDFFPRDKRDIKLEYIYTKSTDTRIISLEWHCMCILEYGNRTSFKEKNLREFYLTGFLEVWVLFILKPPTL